VFGTVIELILYINISVVVYSFGYGVKYVVIISGPHLQTACALGTAAPVAIANDVFESITSTPLASGSSDISFHRVMFREIVP
jgi:hypothetical protein